MATTIDWSISQLDCKPQEDGFTDVVVTAHWQCVATSTEQPVDDKSTVRPSLQIYGTTSFTIEQGAGFTPYSQLTEAQVLNWCYASGVDKDVTEANVTAQLEAQINPPIVTPPLPWVPAPTPPEPVI